MKNIIFDLDLTLVDTSALEASRHHRNWQEAYSLIPHTSLYSGIQEVMNFIRENNITATVVSTSPHSYVQRIVSYYNMPIKFIIGYHDAKPIKPHPAPMLKALELMSCPAQDTISFGDRAIDIQASKAAGVQSYACLWGTKEQSLLLSAPYDQVLRNPLEMIELIKK